MEKVKGVAGLLGCWVTRLLGHPVSLFFIFHFSFIISLGAQEPVSLCSDWFATVDGETQQIVLRWRPSPDSTVMGYHICSGSPCIDYDTVFGRLDTTYICLDHSPLERHSYRLHVFDSAYNVSQLTPPFGNIVLTADIPECEPTVNVEWSPYDSMPGGLGGYKLMAKLEPQDTDYCVAGMFRADDPLQHTIDLPDNTTRVSVKVLAYNKTRSLYSQSNIVTAERRTSRRASNNNITSIGYDTVQRAVRLTLLVDTGFCHTIWRSIDGSPWAVIDSVRSATPEMVYYDRNIHQYNALHCYQISVKDECGLNEQFSHTVWITVPEPPPPGIAIPNIIIAGNESCGEFKPIINSIMGDLYEMSIYNRNGMLVFRTDDPAAAWQPGKDMPQGAYTYNIRVRFFDNKIHRYVGSFVLIR